METKRTHFKMYKSGRRWVFACAVMLVTLGAGGTAVANADATTVNANSATAVSSSSNSTSDAAGADSESGDAEKTATSSSVPSSESSSNQSSVTNSSDKQAPESESIDQTSGQTDESAGTSRAEKTTSVKPGSLKKNNLSGRDKLNGQVKQSIKKTVNQGTTKRIKSYKHTSLSALAQKVAKSDTAHNIASQLAKLAGTAKMTAAVTPYADSGIQSGGSVYDDFPDLDNILGVSSVFHIFAREAELNAHTNGNVAVQNLIGNVNFGTNVVEELLDKEISYIQNITNIANSSFVSAGDTRTNKVIFGEGINIDISNPNRPMVNGEYIDHLLAREVYQDQNGQTYIDFDAEFAKLKALNEALTNKPSQANYSNADFPDLNDRVIDINNMTPNANNQIVINLTPDVLQSGTPLTISGLSPDAEGPTVIINVDTGGAADYDVTSQIKVIYSDGSERNNQETEYFGDNHLLWNFYDSTASDKQFTGNLNIERPFQGSILAPSATIVANANVDGNLIADKVIVNAETHRWDLQGNGDEEEDENEFDIPNIDRPGVELPEVPTTEEPEPENPDTENPGTEEPGVEEPDVEEPDTETPDEEENGDEDLTYEHQRPEYTEEMAEEFEDDLIDFEKDGDTAGEESLLNQVDDAIATARAKGETQLVAQLESVRSNILRALGLSDGLPQTGEAHEGWLSAVGFALAGTLLATGVAVDRKWRY